MKIYRSSLSRSFGWRLIRHIFLFKLIFMLSIFPIVKRLIITIGEIDWIILLVGYSLITILYLGFFNNNFSFGTDKVEIRSSLFSFFNPKKIKYSYIKQVRMPHEGDLENNFFYNLFLFFIPIDWKWIEITTNSNCTFSYYCFGLEYDCYDSVEENDLMENVFKEFRNKGVNIKWTKADDDYFDRMTRDARMRNSQSQKY